MKPSSIFFFILFIFSCKTPERAIQTSQNPSPMVEYTRPHHRIPLDSVPDEGINIDFSREVQGRLYVPDKYMNEDRVDLLIHFHGDGRVAKYAVDQQSMPWILFHCHWGGGSSAYSRPIQELGVEAFLDSVVTAVHKILPETRITGIYLSGWSAGYGAIRRLISEEKVIGRIEGILLLDGLHCSYVPEGRLVAQGGALDSTQMQPFLKWAKLAISGRRSLLFTHSSVFPGTFASTTETAEYLLQSLGIRRQSKLAEGPVGMQQTSVAAMGRLMILSFAGNSAPDHVDHYHGMSAFLHCLEEIQKRQAPIDGRKF